MRHRLLIVLLALLSPSSVLAVQWTATRCAPQPNGDLRVVLDLDGPAKPSVTELPAATEHELRLPKVSTTPAGRPRGCNRDEIIVLRGLQDLQGTVQLQLHTRRVTRARVFLLRPYAGRGYRLVLDLSPASEAEMERGDQDSAMPETASVPPSSTPASSQASSQAAPQARDIPRAPPERESAGVSSADRPEWRVRGFIGLEGRGFLQGAQFAGQKDSGVSLVAEPEFLRSWGDDHFTFRPFARWDQHDGERSKADIRELMWLRARDRWEIAAGIGKVFWGVTEVQHLVDIINQTDLVENPDGEQKLGQPMIRVAAERDWGTVTLFALPWFRERTFPGEEGRLRTNPKVDTDEAEYRNGRSRSSWDWALRWSHYIDDLDIGLAHFHGTGREPTLVPGLGGGGQPVLIPVYEQIDQTSLDAQLTRGDWLWKLEALRRSGQGDAFWAATGGFEYTLVGINNSAADLGLLAEVMYDNRGGDATTAFNRDVFAGVRWTANDADSTEILTGVVRDWDNGAKLFNLEASRRFGQRWKLQVQARVWFDIPDSDQLAPFAKDDYIETTLFRYF